MSLSSSPGQPGDGLSLNKTYHGNKNTSRKYNQQRRDVLQQHKKKGKSNFIQISHRSNQLFNQQKQSLTKATTPISIPKKNSTSHSLLITDENIVRPRKVSPTSLTFDSKKLDFTQKPSTPKTSHIDLSFPQSNLPSPGFYYKTVNFSPKVVHLQSYLLKFQQNGQFWLIT